MTMRPRERLIMGAIDLIRRNGVAGTGMTELLAHSNTARRSIYQNFPRGKQQLIEEATRTAGQVMAAAITATEEGGSSASRLASFVRMWKDTLLAADFTAGCPVVAAALSGSEVPAAPTIAAEAFAEWEGLIAEQLTGEGLDAAAAESLATMAVAAIEGAVVMSIATRSVTPLDRAAEQLDYLLRCRMSERG
ncbi:TetR/AcrR family transcriptional regulator [Nocardia sp. NPDC051756]|uniref:TetR/AcrR family transcriptional regulator n=1 Tax=Nocardia sp. NPDC051756 TaxID=3154751 RepID=UPI00342FCCFB